MNAPNIEIESTNRCFGGRQLVVSHDSVAVKCRMRFGIYLPSAAAQASVPAVYYLSGLTCTEQNVITKAGAQRYCEEHGVALVCPDTSPRGSGIPDDDSTDLGVGAGFYVNATRAPWDTHYRMYDYVVEELPGVVEGAFAVRGARAIMGHSMGGHGALVLGLREPGVFHSVSAFSPIASPRQSAWGIRALTEYLGDEPGAWSDYDASELLRRAEGGPPILVDVGSDDPFIATQLKPELLEAAATASGYPLTVRRQTGYDHSYFFVQTFVGEHIAHHARALHARARL